MDLSSFKVQFNSFKSSFILVKSDGSLEAFQARSTRLQALLKSRTRSFIQGGGLVAKGGALEIFSGATLFNVTAQRCMNCVVNSSTENVGFINSGCWEA